MYQFYVRDSVRKQSDLVLLVRKCFLTFDDVVVQMRIVLLVFVTSCHIHILQVM